MKSEGKPTRNAAKAEEALRKIALSYPETYEEFPWGERAVKVNKKVFLFMRADATGIGLSTKLPHSGLNALLLPFAEPTHYGLGKSGWVSASFGPEQEVPVDMLAEWIDESYRAVAPKKLVNSLASPTAAKTAKSTSPKPSRRAR